MHRVRRGRPGAAVGEESGTHGVTAAMVHPRRHRPAGACRRVFRRVVVRLRTSQSVRVVPRPVIGFPFACAIPTRAGDHPALDGDDLRRGGGVACGRTVRVLQELAADRLRARVFHRDLDTGLRLLLGLAGVDRAAERDGRFGRCLLIVSMAKTAARTTAWSTIAVLKKG